MKAIFIFVLSLSVYNLAHATEKAEIIREIFYSTQGVAQAIEDYEQDMQNKRKEYLEYFKPEYERGYLTQDEISRQEILYNKVKSSDAFYIDFNEILKPAIEVYSSHFTLKELKTLKDILNSPLMKKSRAVGEKAAEASMETIKIRAEEIQKELNQFVRESEAINKDVIKRLQREKTSKNEEMP